MSLYVVLYEYAPETAAQRAAGRPDHARFLRDLHARDILMLSGPFTTGLGAMLMVRAESQSQAEDILDRDPFAIADLVDRRRIEPFALAFGMPGEIDRIDLSTVFE